MPAVMEAPASSVTASVPTAPGEPVSVTPQQSARSHLTAGAKRRRSKPSPAEQSRREAWGHEQGHKNAQAIAQALEAAA